MYSVCSFGISRCLGPGQSYPSTRASGHLEIPGVREPKCICSTYEETLDKVMMLTVMKMSIKKCQLSPTERQQECQIPLWTSQIPLRISFCLGFITLNFIRSKQTPSVTSFLSSSLWKHLEVQNYTVYFQAPIFTSLSMLSTSPVLSAFSSTWLHNLHFSGDLWAIFTGTSLPESYVHVALQCWCINTWYELCIALWKFNQLGNCFKTRLGLHYYLSYFLEIINKLWTEFNSF